MQPYHNLTSYCSFPPNKIANYHIENIKGDMSLARPVKRWKSINDRSNPPSPPPSKRTIRSEDVNIRDRSIDLDAKGRLTDFETEEYMRQINEDAKRFALIGEKVITDLFKVQVPDPSDMEYINKRSEIMAQLKMTKEEADDYLKQNFREQYKTKKSVDITRMDAPVTVMLDVFNQMEDSMERSPENVARMKNVLNNMLLKEGRRTAEEIQRILNILINKPFYRVDYRPDSPLQLLGYLSNIVVGNVEEEQDVGVERKQADPNVFGSLNPASLMDVARQLERLRPTVVQQNDEQKDNNIVTTVDNVVEQKEDLVSSGDVGSAFGNLSNIEEEPRHESKHDETNVESDGEENSVTNPLFVRQQIYDVLQEDIGVQVAKQKVEEIIDKYKLSDEQMTYVLKSLPKNPLLTLVLKEMFTEQIEEIIIRYKNEKGNKRTKDKQKRIEKQKLVNYYTSLLPKSKDFFERVGQNLTSASSSPPRTRSNVRPAPPNSPMNTQVPSGTTASKKDLLERQRMVKQEKDGKGYKKTCPKGKKHCDCDLKGGKKHGAKPKQKRKESDWIKYVKSVQKSEGLSYKDALKVASLMRKK